MSKLDLVSNRPDSSNDGVSLEPSSTLIHPMQSLTEAVDRLEGDIRRMIDPHDSGVTRLSSLTLMRRCIDLYGDALFLILKAPYSDQARQQGERIIRLRNQWL